MNLHTTTTPTARISPDTTAGALSSSRCAQQTRRQHLTALPLRAGALLAALLVTIIAVFGATGAAQASANKCTGGLNPSCIDVKGKHRHVDRIRSQVIPAGRSCIYGHSQVMIGGRHYADSNGGRDDVYCGAGWPGKKITTGTWYVNRAYAKGSKICAKFWEKVDGRYRNSGNACVTVG